MGICKNPLYKGAGCALLIEWAYWTVAKPVPERTTSMSGSQQLYNRVSTKLQALHPTMHLKRLTVCRRATALRSNCRILSRFPKTQGGDLQWQS